MPDEDGLGWTIACPTGVEIHIMVGTWEVDCADASLKMSVEEAIRSLVEYLS